MTGRSSYLGDAHVSMKINRGGEERENENIMKIGKKTCSKTSSIVCSIRQRKAWPVWFLHAVPQKTAGHLRQGMRLGLAGSWTRQVAQWL